MKKRLGLIFLAIALMTTLLLSSTASANSWNLKGKLLQAMIKTHDWDDYILLGNQADPFAVMQSRYHHALFFVDDLDRLHVYTTAVYQPDDKREAPSLMVMDQDLYLSYGNNEQYVFRPWTEDGEYLLTSATIGDFQLNGYWEDDDIGIHWYWAYQEGSTALWPVRVRLSDFNIRTLWKKSERRIKCSPSLTVPASASVLLMAAEKTTVRISRANYCSRKRKGLLLSTVRHTANLHGVPERARRQPD